MRLLILTSRVPYPIEKGDKLRVYNFIRELSKYHDVFLFSIDECNSSDDCINHLKQFCKEIKLFRISKKDIALNILRGSTHQLPLQVSYYTSPSGINAFNAFVEHVKPDHIFCQLLRVTEYVKNISIPKTIDIQDTMSINIQRSNSVSNFFIKPIFYIEANRLKKYENYLFDIFNNKVIISKSDRDLYPHKDKNSISIIPNGVDYNYFHPANDVVKDLDVVFTGNMGYRPNIDASLFLLKDIYPILLNAKPNINITIVGTNPPSQLRNLSSDNITVTGWVDDIRDYYARAKVFVAPMRIGTGLQNKLLEAMAMYLPCITTPLANESLGAKSFVNILVGKDKYTIANHILALLDDSALAKKIASAGFDFVHKTYEWSNVGDALNKIITS